jgi:hypothetical protein
MLASCIASVTFSTEELDAADEGCKDAGLESPRPSAAIHARLSLRRLPHRRLGPRLTRGRPPSIRTTHFHSTTSTPPSTTLTDPHLVLLSPTTRWPRAPSHSHCLCPRTDRRMRRRWSVERYVCSSELRRSCIYSDNCSPRLPRALQACLTCRTRKVKCCGTRPRCGACVKSAIAHGECVLLARGRGARAAADRSL